MRATGPEVGIGGASSLGFEGLPADVAETARHVQQLVQSELQLEELPMHISAQLQEQLPQPLADAAREIMSIVQLLQDQQEALPAPDASAPGVQ